MYSESTFNYCKALLSYIKALHWRIQLNSHLSKVSFKEWSHQTVADFGGGGRSSSGVRPPADPKLTFVLFWDNHCWLTDLKVFLKAPLAPICTDFKGERAPKKRNFLVEIFQKVPKNAFLRYEIFEKLRRKSLKEIGKLNWWLKRNFGNKYLNSSMLRGVFFQRGSQVVRKLCLYSNFDFNSSAKNLQKNYFR